MSSDERLRILHMVAEGKLTAAEADELLAALQPPPATPRVPLAPSVAGVPLGLVPPQRYLVIRVIEGDQPKVNARIPLGLARGAKWLSGLTEQFLSEYDLDVRGLVESLGDAPPDGTLLDIQDGDTLVWIGVESAVDRQPRHLSPR